MLPQKASQRTKPTTKTTHSLSSPFPEPSWPQVQPDDQQTILDLLCILLADLGHYHKSLVVSKGKRRKAEKRKERDELQQDEVRRDDESSARPEIRSHVLIGFNEVQRCLERVIRERSQARLDGGLGLAKGTSSGDGDGESKSEGIDGNLVAVFIDRTNQPLIMTRHLPGMMAAAISNESPLWLVTLPSGGGIRLGETVGIPRLGFCGLMAKAPGSVPLLHYLEEHIQPVQPPAVDMLLTAFFPLKVDTYSIEVEAKSKNRQRKSLAIDGDAPRKSKKHRRRKQLVNQQP